MRVLVIGGGGREHAIAWRFAADAPANRAFCVPGNAGIQRDASCVAGDIMAVEEMASLAEYLGVDCTVVGPEAPLVAGIADEFRARGLPVVGPSAAAARLEGSKAFAKAFLRACAIPTAESVLLERPEDVAAAVGRFGFPVALKADGLAAGKGVVIAGDMDEAVRCAQGMLSGDMAGAAGRRIVVEQFLDGEEVSFIVLSDGRGYCLLPATQDYKRALDGDLGPNTGGMGAYCDDSILPDATRDRIVEEIVEPALTGMRRRGTPFSGFLYCGLMITADGPKVLEFNVRLGDPEAQPMLYRMDPGFAELLHGASRGALDRSLLKTGAPSAACVVLASGGYPGKYDTGARVDGLDAARSPEAKVFHAGTRLSGGVPVTSGGRVLGVTAAGNRLDEALGRAYAAAGSIRFDGARYRRDIGRRGLARAGAGIQG